MNMNNETWKRPGKHNAVAPTAVMIGLTLFPLAEARADYDLAGRTTMRVAAHVDVAAIAQTVHTQAFTNASSIIQTDSGAQDVACPFTLRAHSFVTFGTTGDGLDVIDNSTEYNTIQTTSTGYYNVVNTIMWCNGTLAVAAGGCGHPEGGKKPFMVNRSRATSGARGNVLAHEFGHTVGRSHDNNASRIMDPDFLTTAHNEVTPFGCDMPNNGFRRVFNQQCNGNPVVCSDQIITIVDPPDNFASLLTVAPSMSLDIEALRNAPLEENDFSRFEVTQLLDGMIIDRVPAEVEDYYADEDVDDLIDVVFDPRKRDQHEMAVGFVGLISSGTDAHVQALLDYMDEPGANVDGTLMALGAIVHRSGSEAALLVRADQFLNGPHVDAAARAWTISGDSIARDLLLEAAMRETDLTARYTLQEQASENKRIERMGLREHYLNPPAFRPSPLPPPKNIVVIEQPLE